MTLYFNTGFKYTTDLTYQIYIVLYDLVGLKSIDSLIPYCYATVVMN